MKAFERLVRRAKDYPFDVPGYPYVFIDGEAWRILELDYGCAPTGQISVVEPDHPCIRCV